MLLVHLILIFILASSVLHNVEVPDLCMAALHESMASLLDTNLKDVEYILMFSKLFTISTILA